MGEKKALEPASGEDRYTFAEGALLEGEMPEEAVSSAPAGRLLLGGE